MKDLRLTVGVAAALVASACSPEQPQDNGWTADRDTAVCVDKDGKRVADDKCPKQGQQQQVAGEHGFGVSPFLWYYLGRMSSVPYYGERVYGGGFAPVAGHSYARAPASTAVTRGGFGSSARGFSTGSGG